MNNFSSCGNYVEKHYIENLPLYRIKSSIWYLSWAIRIDIKLIIVPTKVNNAEI